MNICLKCYRSSLNLSLKTVIYGIILAITLTSCATIRTVTYPPDYTYVSTNEVESTMTSLAIRMDRIDRLLADPTLSTDDRQARILNELDEMEELGIAIGVTTQHTNHLLIDRHLDDFIGQVRRARDGSSEDPPNYYQVGLLSGNCRACHARG